MKSNNEVLDLSFQFAIRIVKLHQYLCREEKEYILSKQLLRAGTSIGANINEAQAAISTKEVHVITLQNDILSIIKLLTVIVKSTKA